MQRAGASRWRWVLLAVAALAMGVAGTYQFVWSSVRVAVGARVGAPETALGTVFTLFVAFQTLSQFPAGWIRDRYGPRVPTVAGAGLLAAGYALVATAGSFRAVLFAYAVAGVGSGIVYTVAMNTAVKWFEDRRGFATGVVAMAYSGVSFLAIPVVRRGIRADFRATMLAAGVAAGAVVLLAAAVLRDPPRRDRPGEEPDSPDPDGQSAAATGPDGRSAAAADPDGRSAAAADPDGQSAAGEPAATWREAVRTWQFWLLYAAFVVANGVGLMVIGKAVAYAGALELSPGTATGAASVVAVGDALGVVLVATASDRFGRESTAVATLVCSGVALLGAVVAGGRGIGPAFVALLGATTFFRSPVYSLFPSLVGDYYGPAHSSENYAVLFTATLPGGVLAGTVASGLVLSLGWSETFALGAAALLAAGLALVALRPPALAGDRSSAG